MWKSHCQLLDRGDPVSKSHGDLSFLECCCEPSSECQADAILHGQSFSLPPESFVDIVCESGCIFPGGFSCSVPSLVWGKVRFSFLSPGQVSWPGRWSPPCDARVSARIHGASFEGCIVCVSLSRTKVYGVCCWHRGEEDVTERFL